MNILLKNLLKEIEEKNPLQVQVYCDMDGVLVNMDKGFKEISGGLSPEEIYDLPEFEGNKKAAQKRFWQLIDAVPNFWINLEPNPDAKILWNFIRDNFKNPDPVILSAGQGTSITEQKTAWIRKHIDPNVKVIIARSGPRKPEYILDIPGRVTHVLVDDMQKNIDAWDNTALHRVAILHTGAASSISQLKKFLPE